MKEEKDIKEYLQNQNQYEFVFEGDDGKKTNCEVLLSFYVKDKGKNFILFTDNTKDKNGDLVVYAYYVTSESEDLIPVTDNSEFNMINEVYKSLLKKVNESE